MEYEYPTGHLKFWYKHTLLVECFYEENTSDKCVIPWYTTGKRQTVLDSKK